eukprot:gene8835-18301_t
MLRHIGAHVALYTYSSMFQITSKSFQIFDLVGVTGIVLSFLPFMLAQKFCFGDFVEESEIPIYVALNSRQVNDAMIFGLGSALPLVVEALRKYLSKRTTDNHDFSNLFLLCAMTIPNIVLLTFIQPTNKYQYIPAFHTIQRILVTLAIIHAVAKFGSTLWSKYPILIMQILLTCSLFITAQTGFITSTSVIDTINLITLILEILGYLIMLYITILWCKYIKNIQLHDMSFEDYSCTIHIALAWILVIGIVLLQLAFPMKGWYDFEQLSSSSKLPTTNNPNPEEQDTLKDIMISCNIAIETLNDMLTFDKLEGGSLKLELNVINIIQILENTINPFMIQARQLGINLLLLPNIKMRNEFSNTCIKADITVSLQKIIRSDSRVDNDERSHGADRSGNNGSGRGNTSVCILQILVVDTGVGLSQ